MAEELNREPTVVTLHLTRRGGEVLTATIKLPDERSALILEAMAWGVRRTGTTPGVERTARSNNSPACSLG